MPASIADFISLQRVNCNDTQIQAVLFAQCVELLGDSIANEIENSGLGKICGEGPFISLAGEVTTATVAENYMNRVLLVHLTIISEALWMASSDTFRPGCLSLPVTVSGCARGRYTWGLRRFY